MRYTRTVISPGFTAAQLDAEFQKIENAIKDTYSRVGDTPNLMNTDLDMNSRRIYNIPYAVDPDEPVSLGQLEENLQNGNFNVIVQSTQQIQDSGVTIQPLATGLNFTGDITVTNGVGTVPNVNVTIPAFPVIPELDIYDQGVKINTADVRKIDFVAGSVTVTEPTPGEIDISIESSLTVENADVVVGPANSIGTLNFLGGGVTVTDAGGGQIDINISGGATSVVNSVNGKSGAVTLTYDDFTSGNINTTGSITGGSLRISASFVDAPVKVWDTAAGGYQFDIDGAGNVDLGQISNTGVLEDVWIDLGKNGAVGLRHNNSTKMVTTSTGISVTGGVSSTGALTATSATFSGTVDLNNNALIDVGSLSVNTTINATGAVTASTFTAGNVDNPLTAARSAGNDSLILLTNTVGGTRFGLSASGVGVFQQTSAAGAFEDNWIVCNRNASVDLYHNNTTRLSTTATGANTNGTHNADAFVTDGTTEVGFDHNRNSAGASRLVVRNTEGGASFRVDSGGLRLYQTNNAGTIEDIWMDCQQNGFVALYYDNGVKLNTVSTGVAVTGALTATGNITAGSSDERTKDIECEVGVEECLECVLTLDVIKYRSNDINQYDTKARQIGLIAQQVQDYYPELTPLAPFDCDRDGGSISGDNYLTLKYERMVAILVGAIQAQQLEIEELKERLDGCGC